METLAEPPESGGADFSTTVLGQIAALTPATAHAESIRQHVLVAQLPVAEVSNLSMVMGAANTALSRATELRAQVLHAGFSRSLAQKGNQRNELYASPGLANPMLNA